MAIENKLLLLQEAVYKLSLSLLLPRGLAGISHVILAFLS